MDVVIDTNTSCFILL